MVKDVDIYFVEVDPREPNCPVRPGWYISGSEYLGAFGTKEDAEFMFRHIRGRRYSG